MTSPDYVYDLLWPATTKNKHKTAITNYIRDECVGYVAIYEDNINVGVTFIAKAMLDTTEFLRTLNEALKTEVTHCVLSQRHTNDVWDEFTANQIDSYDDSSDTDGEYEFAPGVSWRDVF